MAKNWHHDVMHQIRTTRRDERQTIASGTSKMILLLPEDSNFCFVDCEGYIRHERHHFPFYSYESTSSHFPREYYFTNPACCTRSAVNTNCASFSSLRILANPHQSIGWMHHRSSSPASTPLLPSSWSPVSFLFYQLSLQYWICVLPSSWYIDIKTSFQCSKRRRISSQPMIQGSL